MDRNSAIKHQIVAILILARRSQRGCISQAMDVPRAVFDDVLAKKLHDVCVRAGRMFSSRDFDATLFGFSEKKPESWNFEAHPIRSFFDILRFLAQSADGAAPPSTTILLKHFPARRRRN